MKPNLVLPPDAQARLAMLASVCSKDESATKRDDEK